MESNNQEYETPDEIFNPLHKEFHFEVDGCASEKNHKITTYHTKNDDYFSQDLNKTTWVNPEFVHVKKFVKKAYEDSQKFGSTIVMLILVKSNTNWWRDYIMNAKEVRFVNQKVQFVGTSQGLRFPACVVIFAPHTGNTKFSVFAQEKLI
jgi:site-specific DNA-methyltransferase (adenine-specific)